MVTQPGVPDEIRYATGDNCWTDRREVDAPEGAELFTGATGELEELVEPPLVTTAPAPSSLFFANVSNPSIPETDVNFVTR